MEARRVAYFQGLGIDVWVGRKPHQRQPDLEAAPGVPEHQVEPRRTSPAPQTRREVATPSPPVDGPVPVAAFRIRCFRYGRVFVALAEEAWPWRRFLLDVARAMNGFAAAERQDLVFDWPQPGADPAGGGRAFRAFLGHQTRDGERTLISGRRVLDLLGAEAHETALVDGRVYVIPVAPDPAAKKRLWDLIREL